MNAAELLAIDPVIPVVVIDDVAHAAPLARALLDGGLRTIEVTLRTPAALAAIEAIAAEVPEMVVGAGTVVSERQARAAQDAGARFLVAPGATPTLLDALADGELPLLPGFATPSEAMALLERGYECAKLFPAEAAGGRALAASLAGPFPGLRLCPTGGIDETTAAAWLRLPNVACVGGTWIARAPLRGDGWRQITERARAAAQLRAAATS